MWATPSITRDWHSIQLGQIGTIAYCLLLYISDFIMTTLDRPINTKARRVGKLEKPAPLKRSLSVNAGTEEKLHSAKIKLDNSAEQLCAKDVEIVGRESTEDNCKEIAGKHIRN